MIKAVASFIAGAFYFACGVLCRLEMLIPAFVRSPSAEFEASDGGKRASQRLDFEGV